MRYGLEELMPVVFELAKKYAGCDSTSLGYEKMQELMEGVIYCLEECGSFCENGLTGKKMSVSEQYREGSRMVFEKTERILQIYNRLVEDFDDYNVRCLHDTVKKGIPEFLRWYDPKYFPQNTVVMLDYPVLKDCGRLCGADAVYEFIRDIETEQRFLGRLDREYVISVLKTSVPGYENMMENICSMVLMNLLGYIGAGKSPGNGRFSQEDYRKLEAVFGSDEEEKTEKLLREMLREITDRIYGGDREIYEYLSGDIKNLAARIETAARYGNLDRIFKSVP